MHRVKATMLTTGFALAVSAGALGGAGVDYPAEFRSWQHVKSMIIQPGHPLYETFGGIHHVYANFKAMRGLSEGEFDTGAVFVFDLLGYDESGNTLVEAQRKRLDVMQYDAAGFADTDGWGYASFAGNTPQLIVQDIATACYACHQGAKATNFVFSRYRQ